MANRAVKGKMPTSPTGTLNSTRHPWNFYWFKDMLPVSAPPCRKKIEFPPRQCLFSFKQCQGFTLIEVAVVLLLITIILGLAIPRLHGQFFSNDLGRTTRMIGGLAQEARLSAMREGKTYGMEIDPSQHHLRVFRDEVLVDGSTKKTSSREIKAVKIPDSVTITDIWISGNGKVRGQVDLYFSPKGRADHAIIHLQDAKGDQVSLVIEPFLDRVKSVPGYLDVDQ